MQSSIPFFQVLKKVISEVANQKTDKEAIDLLLKCRLVCKDWNYVATPELSNRLEEVVLNVYEENKYNVPGFFNLMQKTELCPFTKFAICPSFLRNMNKETFKHFLTHCAPTCSSLRMEMSYVSEMTLCPQISRHFNFNALRNLRFTIIDKTGFPLNIHLPNFLKAILCSAPKLHSILLDSTPHNAWSHHTNSIARFGSILVKYLPKSVKELHVAFRFTNELLVSLIERGLKLHILYMDLCEAQLR